MALALAHGMQYGVRGVLPAAAGNVVASLFQAAVAFLALNSILALNPATFLAIQFLGALYIGYIGIGFIRDHLKIGLGGAQADTKRDSLSSRFASGMIIALFNPKAILFFVALFPLFISPQIPTTGTLVFVFFPIGSIALICFILYGVLGSLSADVFGKMRFFKYLIPALGLFLIATAIIGVHGVVSEVI